MTDVPDGPTVHPVALPATLTELVLTLVAQQGRDTASRFVDLMMPGLLTEADRIVALAWGTIDLDRTIGAVALPFTPASGDDLLGATAARARVRGIDVLVEEPRTEGRLAAFLARFGEGICAVYLKRPRVASEEAATSGRSRPVASTPLGRPARLLSPARSWGPFGIVLDPA